MTHAEVENCTNYSQLGFKC